MIQLLCEEDPWIVFPPNFESGLYLILGNRKRITCITNRFSIIDYPAPRNLVAMLSIHLNEPSSLSLDFKIERMKMHRVAPNGSHVFSLHSFMSLSTERNSLKASQSPNGVLFFQDSITECGQAICSICSKTNLTFKLPMKVIVNNENKDRFEGNYNFHKRST